MNPIEQIKKAVSLLEENKTKVISIPPGTQNNGTYRIPGAGIPRLRGGGRGNLR